jgi:kinesin family member 5
MKCDKSIFQLQESMARELEKKLTKVTEELTSQVQSLKEKISGLISEKV